MQRGKVNELYGGAYARAVRSPLGCIPALFSARKKREREPELWHVKVT